jgi:5-methylcytosine-specific restriction protein A
MPTKPKRLCNHPHCNELVDGSYCDKHQPILSSEKKYHHMYNNTRWKQARLSYLKANPLCVMCKDEGQLTPAQVVDHITPHKGDYKLFWDVRNWQSLCCSHHNEKTAREDGAYGNKSKA